MTDTQLLTLVVSLAIPLALLIYSNSKVQDAKEVLRAEQKLASLEVQQSIADLKREMIEQFARLDMRMRSLELHRDN